MQAGIGDDEQATPRPPKRRRDLEGAPVFSAIASVASNPSSNATDDASTELESHQSGRLSPTKQLHFLEQRSERTVVFCNHYDVENGAEPLDVVSMHDAMQRYGDGVGILGYPGGEEGVEAAIQSLNPREQTRFRYAWANDAERRLRYGSMPPITELADLVLTARHTDQGPGKDEETWNSEVHLPLLKLARRTSTQGNALVIESV